MGKALANLIPATLIRFGACTSPRSHTNWAVLISPPHFRQFFPGLKTYSDLEQLLSSKHAGSCRVSNRWQSQLPRIRCLRHLIYQVIQDAEHLVTNYRFSYGLCDFTVGIDYWHAGLTSNGLLHSCEARYLYVLNLFLTQIGVIDLAANARQLLYARLDNPRNLWTLVHVIVNRLDPLTNHFDLNMPPATARQEATIILEPAELDKLDESVA